MKLNKQEALDWLEQAEHNLKVAISNFENGFYSDSCFMAEQSAQVALKSYIIYHKKRYIWEHSIQELSIICCKYDKDFESLITNGKILDKYYIPTRYPNALASPAVPFKSFTEEEASNAIGLAQEIIKTVKTKLRR